MEAILVPLIVFSFVAAIVKMSLDYNKWKQIHKSNQSLIAETEDKSMGMSELRLMIQEAVQEANEPLVNRISKLEGQVEEGRALQAKEAPKQLSAPVEDQED